MKFATSLTTVATLINADHDCNYALELLALQDGSDSFAEHVDSWASAAGDLINKLAAEFEEFKIGLASFTDKPIPKSGYGQYGGWTDYKQDYCYARHVTLTTSVETMTQGLNELKEYMGSGMDSPEAQAEAMIYAALDSTVGWSDPSVTHSDSGRPIVRVILLITDARAHEEGDALKNINQFNAPRSYPNGYDQPSTGGFGAHDFPSKSLISAYMNEESMALYTELADLFAKYDHGEAEGAAYLSTEEEMRLKELIDLWGPYPYPSALATHPGDNSISDCSQTEYPSLTQTMAALSSRNILPVILTSTEDAYAFYEWYQTNVFSTFNISTTIAMFDSATVFDDMITAISNIVEKECLLKTTETPPTEEVLSSEPITVSGPLVSDLSQDTTVVEEPTEDTLNSSPSTASTEEEEANPTIDVSTEWMEDIETETTETDTEYIYPPIVPPSESNIGTIAGASAGAVAGVAGVAALLYKQFGASLFHSSPAPSIDMVQQVEATDDVMDREAVEEVTMDMFH